MMDDSPATGWSSIDALADVARLYPEGVAVPVFAGRIVWPDHRDPTVEDFGDVHLTPDGVSLTACIWTGGYSSAGNPTLTWVEPPFTFPDIDALRTWLMPPPSQSVIPEPEPEPVYIERLPADVLSGSGEWLDPTAPDTSPSDAVYIEPDPADVGDVSGGYTEADPPDPGSDDGVYIEPDPADTTADVIAFVDPEAFDPGPESGPYYPPISEV